MSTPRMRAMVKRLNVDWSKFAFANVGLVFAATRTCHECKHKAECAQWLDDAASAERPTFCPNLDRFEPFMAPRLKFGRPAKPPR